MRRMVMAAMAAAGVMATAGCGFGEGGGGVAAGEPLTFEEAQIAAADLGTWMTPIVAEADLAAQGAESLEAKRAVFESFFGPKVSKTETSGGFNFGNAFVFDVEMFTATTGGDPTLLTWSLTGGAAFFYEPTVVDVRTGAIYQGSFMGTDLMGMEFFGPLVPPAGTRIVGSFTVEEIGGIETALMTSLHDEESPE